MKTGEDDDDSEYCSSRQDLIDAAAAADVIGIELEAVNFAKEYKARVFSIFLGGISKPVVRRPTQIFCATQKSNSNPSWITL